MKLHSVVDTITNSSSVEFMIPNPDGVMTEEEFKNMMIAAMIDGVYSGDLYTLRRVLEFIPDGRDIYWELEQEKWHKETLDKYTQEDLTLAATEWFNEMAEVTWTKFSVFTKIHESSLSPKITAIIEARQGTRI